MPALRSLLLVVALTAVACSATDVPLGREAIETTVPTTTSAVPTTSPPPTTSKPALPPTTIATSGSCGDVPEYRQPDPNRPDYFVAIEVDPEARSLRGAQQVVFRPDLAVDRLVFRTWANGPRPAATGTSMELSGPTLPDGTTLYFDRPDPTTYVVLLPEPVEPGGEVTVQFTWTIQVGGPSNDRFSASGGSLRLGSFVPLLAWQPGIGWADDPPTSGFAEATTSPTADWSYTVGVPNGWRVMATGVQDINGRFVAEAVRDIAISIGRFTVVEGVADAGRPVAVSVGVHDQIDDPGIYLGRVIASLEQFARDYGPYPWPAYSLAITPDLSGGIEFPMHVMQGPGTQGRTTPHEVAHMWFYGLVGSNQGRSPWLDEGLATWAEGRFEGTIGDMAARPIPDAGRGRAGEAMTFWETRADSYYRSVYVQTAAALSRLGPEAQVDCMLAHYVARSAHTIATPADLYTELDRFFPAWRDALGPAGLAPPG